MKQSSHRTIRFLKFPHNSRIINANRLIWGLKLVVLGFLTVLILINLFPALLNPFGAVSPSFLALEQAKIGVMLSPKSLSPHLLLAQEYLKRGDLEEMERELLIAQTLATANRLSSNNSVLATSLSPLKVLEQIKNEPKRIRGEISFWEKVILEKPDYRDAYLQLAILSYQSYEKEKAKSYLGKALDLDPNFEPARKLEEIIK